MAKGKQNAKVVSQKKKEQEAPFTQLRQALVQRIRNTLYGPKLTTKKMKRERAGEKTKKKIPTRRSQGGSTHYSPGHTKSGKGLKRIFEKNKGKAKVAKGRPGQCSSFSGI